MGRTERVLVLGSIAFLLALTTPVGAADPAAPAGVTSASRLPASPAAFAERAASAQTVASQAPTSFRNALELIVLAATCGIAVAFYSASAGGHGGKRMPMRIRRR